VIAKRLLASALRGIGLSRQAARYEARMATRALGYDGAAGGRRGRGMGDIPLAIPAQLAARQPLARRARYLVANNGHAAAGANVWESALIGCGIKPQSAHPDEATRRAINAAWSRWTEHADRDGLTDFYGLQSIVARRLVVDGEAFAVFVHGGAFDFQLRLMDGEQVNGSYHTELANGARIVAGVELDDYGRRIAYHAWKQRPGLPIATSLELIRMPADDVAHVFRPETPGQVRGVSWFAPVLLRLADLDSAHDAQIMRQKVAALLAGFVIDPNGDGAGFDGTQDGAGNLDGGLEPGTLKVLAPGQDIRFSDPASIGQEAVDFLKVTAREIAAGLGVPYEAMSGDLSSVSYSSIRAGLVDFRRRVEAHQHNLLVYQFCRPIWRRFVTTEILAGRLDGRGFERDPEPFFSANWLTPKQDWVDPLKDVEAEVLAIDRGLMSRRQAVAARGYDLEALDAEIAQDRAAAAALGLDFSAARSPANKQEPTP
jgi:lambda family phage portal protein